MEVNVQTFSMTTGVLVDQGSQERTAALMLMNAVHLLVKMVAHAQTE
jgi:hypothetical protein